MSGYGIDPILFLLALWWVIFPLSYLCPIQLGKPSSSPPSKECKESYRRFKTRLRPTTLTTWCRYYEAKKAELGLTDEQFMSWLDEVLPANWKTWHAENQARISPNESNL